MKIRAILIIGLAFMIFAGCNTPARKADNTAASDSNAVVGQTGDKFINTGKPDETRWQESG